MNGLVALLGTYGYIVLFLGVIVEGEIFPLAAGFAASLGTMNFYLTIAVTFVGSVLGDILWYKAAEHWGRKFIDRFGHKFFFKPERVAWLEEHFVKYGAKTLFITKFVYSFGHSSIIIAGIARMNFNEFLKVDIASSLLWSIAFVVLGHAFGASFNLLHTVIKDVSVVVALIIGLIIGLQIFIRRKLKKI